MKTEIFGYLRKDGSVGFRNHILIMPLTGCLQEVARKISDAVPGSVPLLHPNGCDLHGPDFQLLGSMMTNLATHANVAGVILLSMNCTATRALRLPNVIADSGRMVEDVNIHRLGTTRTIHRSISIAKKMAEKASKEKKEEVGVSSLIIGTKCGSSSSDSFAFCHPVLGNGLDRIVDAGGTVVLSEDCELYAGAEDFAKRAVNEKVANDIREMARKLDEYWKNRFNINLTPSDAESREKNRKRSLEHADKAGSRPIQSVIDMSEKIKEKGLVILNAPNTDLENMTSLASSGCQVIMFTTGHGTVTGSPVSITVKMTATEETVKRMRENIDLDVSGYKKGTLTLDKAGEKTFKHIVTAVNGKLQKAEINRNYEIAFPIRGVTF